MPLLKESKETNQGAKMHKSQIEAEIQILKIEIQIHEIEIQENLSKIEELKIKLLEA